MDPIRVHLKNGDGTDVDLSAVASTSIVWHFKSLSDGATANTNLGTIISNGGRIQLDPVFPFTAVGDYEIEVNVAFGAGNKSYPVKDKFIWRILPGLV
ncbi:MAG TPA: hypothetical protein VNA25_05120 [Phycisphaerae bacterium]|nr:hypothetical protein [Phycisphaerae bacterium]